MAASKTPRRSAVAVAILALGLPHSLPLWAVTQETGVLRITVVLADADGQAAPIPRVVLLVSANPANAEPRRLRTGADGAVEVALPPGNYTVESDVPVTLGGRSYLWTQTVDVARAGKAVLSLTPANADVGNDTGGSGAGAPMRADAAATLAKWRNSIVELWTPTTHASGFVIDARGLIATYDKAIGEATSVEVEFALRLAGDDASPPPRSVQAPNRFKIPGRVVASDKQQGVAIIWIDPASVASAPVIRPDCSATPGAHVAPEQKVVALAAPLLEPKEALPGIVGRVEASVFHIDWRLTGGSTGGPVFDAGGRPIGITIPDEPSEDSRRRDSRAIPINNACSVLAAAEKKIAGATPPAATRLRVEDSQPAARGRKPADAKAPRSTIPTLSAANFDIALLTPAMVDNDPARWNPRSDFGNWNHYVNNAPPVLMVRVMPQFEESVWKTILRGAAQTQGVALPPLRSFTANFLRLRAFCGGAEVAPIHPFVIEREVAERATIREGLYVFSIGDFGTHCSAVRFDLYSEKAPDKPDSRAVDPKLFAQITGASP